MSFAGLITYVAIFGVLFLWITPWALVNLIFSGLTGIEPEEAVLFGLLLGPLSVILLGFLSFSEKKSTLSLQYEAAGDESLTENWD